MIDVIGTDAGAPASLPAAQQALIKAADHIAAPKRLQPAHIVFKFVQKSVSAMQHDCTRIAKRQHASVKQIIAVCFDEVADFFTSIVIVQVFHN